MKFPQKEVVAALTKAVEEGTDVILGEEQASDELRSENEALLALVESQQARIEALCAIVEKRADVKQACLAKAAAGIEDGPTKEEPKEEPADLKEEPADPVKLRLA